MPDKNGVLSKLEIDGVISRLKALDQQRGKTLSCPVCGHQKWTIQPYVVGVQPVGGHGANVGPYPAQQLVMVNCNNCTNTLFFNAGHMGVQQKDPPPQNAFSGIAALMNPPPPKGWDGDG